MVSTPVKTSIPPKTEQAPVYTLEKVGNVFENWILRDDTRRSEGLMPQVGRIGEFTMPEYRGQFWAEPSGRLDSRRFSTVEAAQEWLIQVYEQQKATAKYIADALVAEYAA